MVKPLSLVNSSSLRSLIFQSGGDERLLEKLKVAKIVTFDILRSCHKSVGLNPRNTSLLVDHLLKIESKDVKLEQSEREVIHRAAEATEQTLLADRVLPI